MPDPTSGVDRVQSREKGAVDVGRGGVTVVGSITADVTTFSQRLPAPGETVLGDDLTLVLGGKGANQAVAAALAGRPTCMVGCIGDDPFGDLAMEGLVRKGVDVSQVQVVPGSTGVAHIRVDASGENDIVIVPLANGRLTEQLVEGALSRVAPRSGVLVTQLEIPQDVARAATRLGRAAGMTVILDPAPAVPVDPALWRDVDVVTPNETEAALLTGVTVVDVDSAATAGRWFLDHGVGSAVITLAGAGAVLVEGHGVTRFEPFEVRSVDTTAAGDAFAGYLAAGLAAGLDLHRAITQGMAAGALAVTVRGASPSLPDRAAVDRLMTEQRGAGPRR